MLKPLNFNTKSTGTALVELKEQSAIETPDAQFKSYDHGIVVSLNEGASGDGTIIGKKVYFEQYTDSAKVEDNDKTYAFIKLENILGFKDE